MVSEPFRRNTYAAVVTGEMRQYQRAASPITQSPVQDHDPTVPQTGTPPSQRTHSLQRTPPQQRASIRQLRSLTMEDLDNPLFLNANDNPCAILVNPPLQGSANYGSWSISMQIALEVKNKWCIIDGSISAPSREDSKYTAWRPCNLIICSWIFKSVHASIAQSIMHLDNAREVWEDLKRRFSQCDAQKISTLQSEIYNLKQGTLTVNDYYTRCRILWEEMNALRPLPICKCDLKCSCGLVNPKCSCGLINQIRQERDVDQVIHFLQGLNDDYSSLKSNVLVLDPLPEVYKVFVMAEKLERQIALANLNLGNLEFSQAHAVQSEQGNMNEVVAAMNSYSNQYNGRRNGNSNKGAKCTYCGMSGHTVDKCFKKHGYPPGWIPGYKSKGKQAAAVNLQSGSLDSLPAVATADQMEKLISLLQTQIGQSSNTKTSAAVTMVPNFNQGENSNEGKSSVNHINSILLSSSTWIIVSGASDHIICDLNLFDNYHVACGTEVNLPTGKTIAVTHTGNVRLNRDLWLKDALYIPSFKFNLISDPLGKIVGLARQTNGLYLLTKPPSTQNIDHKSVIAQYIWGPFHVAALRGERYFLTLVDDYSRFTWLHLMKNKSEVREHLKRFHAMAFTQFGALIKTIWTDNGTEFNMADFLADKGINHQKSCVYTPQQNAVVERKHQHILNVARALKY
ncbi:PREDICTED: uncharacterized protein LOC109175115 [Ipomoea nil]|uniref:uncharacterized protein LOC109175115 n=1 Tax=Ipomoea nil TaxID=35883 RepID=UPI0009012373|nr:PREDICTED: uncharacterized protein LOC109175115 [Ipomoea nil]